MESSNSSSTISRSITPTIQQSRARSPKDFVTRVLSPKIAVISSQDADQVCQINNFPDFFSLIKPFGERIEGRVTIQDSQGLRNAIENFTVRFAHLTSLEQPDVHLTSQFIAEKVKSIGSNPNTLDDLPLISKKSDANELVNQDDITPWYTEYRRLFCTFTGVSEHDTFDHPVACIIAISSSNPDLDNTLRQLYSSTPPAPIFEKGFIDPNILKCYVLLHDEHKVTLEHSEAVFEKMKRTYGLDCYLLKLNSIKVSPEDNDLISAQTSPVKSSNFVTDIWTPYINENNILQTLLAASTSTQSTSTQSTSFEHHSRQNSLTSLSSYSLPLSPTVSTLSSPTSSFNEETIFSKENIAADSQSAIGFNLIGNIAPPPVIYGRFLSEDDISGIHTFVGELVRQSIVPYMERNIRQWNEQVASSRRGITGRLFSAGRRYFSTGSKSTINPQSAQSPYASNTHTNNLAIPIYAYNTPEAQMRKLADYAFMLRDYKFAHSVYDSVKKDFSADKAWKYYAGAQEMIGICLLMASTNIGSRTDIDHYFEQSVNTYLNRVRTPFYATKTTLLYYEMLKFRNLYKDAPAALVRMTGDDSDLRSALFLEQAALAFLRCPRPMVRKYAFHIIMAGHRYGKCNQREHAYRCYLAASKVFENHSWSLVEDHIHFALGRQSFHLGDLDTALKFFLKLLRASRQPATQQSAYLKEFLYIYKQYSLKKDKDFNFEPQELPIPIIDDYSVRVVLSNFQSNEYDETWDTMEREFLENSFTELDIYGKPRKKSSLLGSDLHRTVCAVGEPFFVQFNVHNPMHIQININDLILECEYISLKVSEENSKNSSSSCEETNNEEFLQKNENSDSINIIKLVNFEAFDLEILPEVCLQGLDKKTISLRVLPKKQGTLKVLGLQYTLNSLVHGIKKFSRHGKRLNDTKEQRMSVVYATDRSLDLMVTSPMPLLEVSFHSFPESLFSGEVTQVVLEINNKGQKGLTDLRVKMSHPSFFCIGDAEMLEQKIYDNALLITEKLKIKNSIFNSSVKDIPLPQNDSNSTLFSLAPGRTTLIPIWIRGDRIGKHVFRFLFTYESEDNNMAMKYRSLRYFKTTQVLPSLKINAFTRPSTRGLNEFILGIEIENLQIDEEFQLVQLSSISPSWIISPINNESSGDADSKSLITPRQTIFIYYRISRTEKHFNDNINNETNSDITPEMFTSNALERLLIGEKNLHSEPSPVNLTITNVPFRDRTITNSVNPLEGFSMNSRIQWRCNTLINQFPFIPSNKYGNIFTLYNTNDVDLALYWSIPSSQRQGHHYIVGINLGVQQNPFQGLNISSAPNRALFEQTIRERALLLNSLSKNKNFKDDSPLKLVIQCADIYEHDFELQSFCIVPITISIKNCSWNKKIGFTLEMISPDQNETNRSNALHKAVTPMIFHWMGSTFKYATLSANEEQTFVINACFIRSGVYDINRWRLTVKYDQNTSIVSGEHHGGRNESGGGMKGYVQMPNTPHLLTLINVKSSEKKDVDIL